jgi:hypothetical protein
VASKGTQPARRRLTAAHRHPALRGIRASCPSLGL